MILIFGIFLIILGLVIRVISIRTLNIKHYDIIRVPEKLVTHGIYSLCRNPMYVGSIIMFIGICLSLTNSIGISICMAYLLGNFLSDRINREEELLCMKFGEEYINYRRKTKL